MDSAGGLSPAKHLILRQVLLDQSLRKSSRILHAEPGWHLVGSAAHHPVPLGHSTASRACHARPGHQVVAVGEVDGMPHPLLSLVLVAVIPEAYRGAGRRAPAVGSAELGVRLSRRRQPASWRLPEALLAVLVMTAYVIRSAQTQAGVPRCSVARRQRLCKVMRLRLLRDYKTSDNPTGYSSFLVSNSIPFTGTVRAVAGNHNKLTIQLDLEEGGSIARIPLAKNSGICVKS